VSGANARNLLKVGCSAIYREFVLPYVNSKRENGRLNWVYNILEKKKESESIIVEDADSQEGFILLPDLYASRPALASDIFLTGEQEMGQEDHEQSVHDGAGSEARHYFDSRPQKERRPVVAQTSEEHSAGSLRKIHRHRRRSNQTLCSL
jgi:hypothetical protein